MNTLWGLLNLVIGYVLFRTGHVTSGDVPLLVFFAGVIIISIQLSLHFSHKYAD